MTILYSYCIPYDDSAAPNPFWGVCTLAICKPRIRLAATVDDWIVGTGSMNSPIGDIAGKVVYAMRVTQKMTMEEYDQFTRLKLPRKIPQMKSADPRRRFGDSIYDFAAPIPPIPLFRPSVHGEGNRSTDLRGGFVLLSNHFFYFGDKPVALPNALSKIVKQGQGHKSLSNAPFVDDFVQWIHDLGYQPATLIGNPQMWSQMDFQDSHESCAVGRKQEAEADLTEPDDSLRHPC